MHHGGVLKLDRAWRSTAVLRVSTGKQAPIFDFWKLCTGVLKVSTTVLRRKQAPILVFQKSSTGVLTVSPAVLRRKKAPISSFRRSSTGVLKVSTAVLRALAVYESKCWKAGLKVFNPILLAVNFVTIDLI